MAAKELFKTTLFDDTNLVAYWRMEGNSNDSKGSYNGSDTAVTYGTSYGIFNQGANFNGSSSIIDVSSVPSISSNVSFCAWIKPSSISSGEKSILTIHVNSYSNYFYTLTYFNNAGTISLVFAKFDGTNNPVVSYTVTLPTTSWSFICGVKDGSNLYLYLNGSKVGTTTDTTTSTPTYTNINIGGENGKSKWFDGNIDDVAIFSRALSSTEVSNLYNGTLSNRFNEGFFNFF